MNEGQIGSMRKLGITESYKLKRQVVISASEATEMILRYVICLRIDLNLTQLLVWILSFVQHHGSAKHTRDEICTV